MALYDVWFRPKGLAVITVEADSAEEAMELVSKDEELMTGDEIVERVKNALEYDGYEVEAVRACLEE